MMILDYLFLVFLKMAFQEFRSVLKTKYLHYFIQTSTTWALLSESIRQKTFCYYLLRAYSF